MGSVARVDDPLHRKTEDAVVDDLKRRGYTVQSLTYHDNMPEESAKLLSRRYDMTSLVVRTRTDRIAFGENLPSLFIEAKSSSHATGNLAFEALPFLSHLLTHEMLHSVTVYCCYVKGDDCCRGFVVDTSVPISKAYLIGSESSELNSAIARMVNAYFPSVGIERRGGTAGSGDSYFVIRNQEYLKLDRCSTIIDMLTFESCETVANNL